MSPYTVYRLFDASGFLLYVGATGRGLSRLVEHQDAKEWWTDVDTIRTEHFASRELALAAEAGAIAAEKPEHNRHRGTAAPVPLRPRQSINSYALRVLRERSGLSVSALAALAGTKQPHLSNIEAGRRQASPELTKSLAEALSVDLLAIINSPDVAA